MSCEYTIQVFILICILETSVDFMPHQFKKFPPQKNNIYLIIVKQIGSRRILHSNLII